MPVAVPYLRFASMFAYDEDLFQKLVVGEPGAPWLSATHTHLNPNPRHKGPQGTI